MRLLRLFALGLWTLLFWWLWLSGESVRFVGPRTWWVVPLGAVGLAVTTIGTAFSRTSDEVARPAGAIAALALLGPVLMLVLVPSPRLGAAAAANATAGGGAGGLIPPAGDGELSIRDIEYASTDLDYAAALGVAEGGEVDLIGFATHPEGSDGYSLTRFEMWCCAADAVPSSVVILDGRDYPDDTWLRVKGVLVWQGSRFVVDANSIVEVSEPTNPYGL